MTNTITSHVPYQQLPPEAAGLFFIFALGTSARYQCYPPTRSGLASTLETVWNTNCLTLGDLSDPDRLTNLLKQHLAPSAAGAPKVPSDKGGQ
jgi:hypothetical protein